MVHKRGTLYFAASIAALTCAMPSPSFSQDDAMAYFYPSQKWAVERIAGKEPSALPTCTISNQFNNGFIVQFAGTQKGFTNVNLDVRKPTFEKNRRYEVEYSVPGVSRDIIPTKAFKDNLLVSDLREKDEFTDSLRMASVVDIKIQGNGFRLYLTGFEAVMKDYAECITPPQDKLSQAAPVKPPELILPPEEEIVSGSIQLDTPLDKAPPPASSNEPPIAALQESPKEQKQDGSLFSGGALEKLGSPPPTVEQKTIKVERYTEQLAREMDERNKVYEPETTPTQAPVSYQASYDEPEEAPPAKEVKIIRIKPDGAETNASSVKAVVPPQKPDNISFATPASAPKAAAPDPQDIMEAMTESPPQRELIAQDVRALAAIEPSAPAPVTDNTTFIDMRNKIAELEDQLSAIKKEKSMLDDELKATLQDSEQERLSISSNNWNLERATMRYNEAERQIDRLGRQLKNVRQQCDQEKTELERMLFDPELTEQTQISKLSTLEGELEKTKTDFSSQKRQYEERIRILEEQLGKL